MHVGGGPEKFVFDYLSFVLVIVVQESYWQQGAEGIVCYVSTATQGETAIQRNHH